MRCLSPEDVPGLLGAAGFDVSLDQQWYRVALTLDAKIAGAQARVGASPPDDPRRLRSFLEATNRWLPSGTGRVLWIDHFETAIRGDDRFLLAMRRGFGDERELADAPGHCFDRQLWHEEDQLLVTEEHAAALSVLVGIATVLLTTGSDGWLVAHGAADRIEFWEGNIFFHSAETHRLAEATELLSGCPPPR